MTDYERLVLIFQARDIYDALDSVYPDELIAQIDWARKGFKMPDQYSFPSGEIEGLSDTGD